MAYKNANCVLPESLLKEIQKYVDGELIYIPSKSAHKTEWGCRSGAREQYRERNESIRALYREKHSFEEIAGMFFLSVDSIRKIVRETEIG